MTTNDRTLPPSETPVPTTSSDTRRPYEAPKVLRRRSVQRATLFSGGGVSATGLTSSG